jgi:hypothetical protein
MVPLKYTLTGHDECWATTAASVALVTLEVMQLTLKLALGDRRVFGLRIFSCTHPAYVLFNSHVVFTFSVPALLKVIVCSGQVELSELRNVYFTSVGPFTVIVPLKFTVSGHGFPCGTTADNVAPVARTAAAGLGGLGWAFAVGCAWLIVADRNTANAATDDCLSNCEVLGINDSPSTYTCDVPPAKDFPGFPQTEGSVRRVTVLLGGEKSSAKWALEEARGEEWISNWHLAKLVFLESCGPRSTPATARLSQLATISKVRRRG